MKSVTLSVIIPAYNAETYIQRCIDSVITAVGDGGEIIIIDDGSTDNTGAICDRCADEYEQVYVSHQKNAGANESRKLGVSKSVGKYIAFADADDWVDENLYSEAIGIFDEDPETDIVIMGCLKEYPYGYSQKMFRQPDGSPFTEQSYNAADAIEEMVRWKRFSWFLWDKMYRRELFCDETWDCVASTSEDLWNNWVIFHNARRIHYLGEPQYHYYQGAESLTRTRNKLKKLHSDQSIYRKVLEDKRTITEDTRQSVLSFSVKFFLEETRERIFLGESVDSDGLQNVRFHLSQIMKSGYLPTSDSQGRLVSRIIHNWADVYDEYGKVFYEIKNVVDGLRNELNNILIYGTGMIAEYVARILDQKNINAAGYVVSDEQVNMGIFFGNRVFCLTEVIDMKKSILIPIQQRNLKEIRKSIEKAGIVDTVEICVDDSLF